MADLLGESDAVLVEVIARELERLAGEEAFGPNIMISQLLRTMGMNKVELKPSPDRSIDPVGLQEYLVAKGIVAEQDRIELVRSALGFSKDTYMIRIDSDEAVPRTLVIRRNQPAGTTRTTVLDEFPLLKDLHRLRYPIAEPLLLEPDLSILGQPFMLSLGVGGEPDFVNSAADPAHRKRAARDLANFLARLHTQDINDVNVRTLAAADSPAEELGAYFGEWRGFWEECAPSGYPDVLDAFDEVMPDLTAVDTVSLVHSDVGFHNILVDDGGITAVVDWEFAHLGEPEEDLSYCRESVKELVPWDEFLEYYLQAGGREPSAERLRAYNLWRFLRNATCCAVGRRAFDLGLNTDLRVAYAGRIILQSSVDGLRKLRD